MNLTDMVKRVEKTLRSNSPTILTGFGVSGLVTTAYLAAKASFAAAEDIRQAEEAGTLGASLGYGHDRLKARTRLVWKLYIPTTLSGVLTVGCIISGAKIGTKRAAAAYSLLSVSEKAFVEYKDKVVEQLGEKKEKALRDEIAQDRMALNPAQGVVVVGSGNVLCYEMYTGRYFNSDIETLRKAQNTINAQLIRENEANLNDFYHLVGLPNTSYSSASGWASDKLLELSFSTVMSDDGRPCISFEYNYVKPL